LAALAAFAGLVPAAPFAQVAPIRVGDVPPGGYAIGRHMAVLDDAGGRMDVDAAAAPARAADYTPVTAERPNFGYHKSPCWLRFSIDPGASPARLMLQIGLPSLDHVDLYLPAAGGGYTRVAAGDQLPWAARPFPHRNFVFALALDAERPQTYYLRVQSASVLTVPATLWHPDDFAARDRDTQLLLGLFYGLVAGLFIYNLVLWGMLRDPLYLVYVAYVGSFGLALFTFDGLSYEYLWPDKVWWANHALATFMSLGLAFGALFARGFLDTRHRMPRVDRFSVITAAAAFALALFAATGWWFDYGQVLRTLSALAAVASAVTLATAVKAFLDGYRPARTFLLAWSALLVFIVMGALRNFGILPTNFATFYGLHIGLALDVILLSTALAERIRLLAEDRLRAQRALLTAAEDHRRELDVRARELAAANEQLASANEHLEAFSYSVAHDLRAPLRAIDGYAQLLKLEAGPALQATAQRDVGRISAGARRMAQLIDGLLEFSRLGRQAPARAPVAMRALAEAAAREADPKDQVRFEFGALPDARGDAAMLRQVWRNLIANAVKFSMGAPRPLVRVDGAVEGDEVVYRVADNGVGFDAAYADKLFGVFQRLHTEAEFEGTGVGLAIVRRIVERHGGRVRATGSPGRGATFCFTLPRGLPAAAVAESAQANA
jgi:signal transduction histidine kinase